VLLTLDSKKKKNVINLGFTIIYMTCAVVFLLGVSGSLGQISLLSTGNTQLGISTPGNFTDVNDANYKSASVFTAEESGTVDSITAMIARVNTPGNVMAAIYVADSEGNAGALLGTSTETYVSTSMNWVTFGLLSPVPVTFGGQYALAVCSDDYLTVSVTSSTGVRIHNNNYGSFSNQFENGSGIQSDNRGALSIYANITAGSTPTINPNVTYDLRVNPTLNVGGTCQISEPTIGPNNDGLVFSANTPLAISAIPNAGYKFVNFDVQIGSGSSTIVHVSSNPYFTFIKSDMTITANFLPVNSTPTPPPPNQIKNTNLTLAVFGGVGAGLSALALGLTNLRKVKIF
jgi:Divergent InlB B-repeat domain